MKVPTQLLALAVLVAGCSLPGGHAATSPSIGPAGSPSSSPSSSAEATSPPTTPGAISGAFGVLVTPPTGAGTYTVTLVGTDGKVAATGQASSPAEVTCANGAAALVPLPVSTSNDRVYFMDEKGAVTFLTPSGDTGQAVTLPAGSGQRSMFAVSPDDQRIVVVTATYTSSGASTRLVVEDLNGGHAATIFTESGAYTLWPTGWHGTNNLVLAKVPACRTSQGCSIVSCGPLELHVVDPVTAGRRFTLGGSQCVIAGAPSRSGVVCENTAFTQAVVLNWAAGTTRSFAIQGPVGAYLSPDGSVVAVVDNTSTTFVGAQPTLQLLACGWIDDDHVIAGGDAQQQARVGTVSTAGVVPVAAVGTCAGRIPGGL